MMSPKRKSQSKLKKETILLPVRITQEMNDFLEDYVRKGLYSSRQEAIRFFISEKMFKEKSKLK